VTTISENWNRKLEEGEKVQNEFMNLISSVYPDVCIYEDGKSKYADILIPSSNTSLEVKFDVLSDVTGNLAIEYQFRGKPSGIWASSADYFVIAHKDNFYLFNRLALFDWLVINKDWTKKVKGGDDMASCLILVPKRELVNRAFCFVLGRDGMYINSLNNFI